ncbi:MAG TPA: GGDEF domain-containing protein [Gemmatimonadales bacterium]|nr:GGDEF domain-containing protein [Gemmatimonadales bacterium]
MPGRLTWTGQVILETATPKAPSTRGALATSVALLLVLAAVDYAIGYEIPIMVVYLIPVFLATWNVGRTPGMILAVASAALSVGGDVAYGAHYRSWIIPWTMALLWAVLFVVFVLVLTELKRALEREQELARLDALTTVNNRRHFEELAAQELARAKRGGRPLTVAYVDLDNFKQVNDRLGHGAGDVLLQAVAATMQHRLRITDALGRMGGDEFAICLPETGVAAARTVLDDLRHQVLAALPENCRFVTISIGAVTFIKPPMTVVELLHRADQVLYAAKRDGKDQLKVETA